MRTLLLALGLTLPLFAGDSLVLTSGDSLSYDPPNTTPWTALDARRVEMALDLTDWDCTGSTTSRLWSMGADLYIGCGATASSIYLRDGSRTWAIDATARGESLIRFSRDVSGTITPVTYPSNWLEIWDADGTDYAFASTNTSILQGTPENLTTENASGAQSIGGTGIIAQIHWVKQYSTVLWPGPSSPLPGTLGTGDLGDWHFDGSVLTDGSGLGMTISGSGHTFETTPTIAPASSLDAGEANWVDAPTVRAGEAVTLTGTCSSADLESCTCAWSDQGGGSSGVDQIQFTGSTSSCSSAAVFPTFGSYTLRLAVTNSDGTGTTDFEIGAVALDSTDHVVYPSDNIELIVGAQKKFGTSVWPWLDDRRQTIGDFMGERIPDPAAINSNTTDWGQAGAGTISVTNGSATITGSGTDFQNDYCSGGTTNTSTYGVMVIDDAGLYWRMPVSSCNSATSITASYTWNRTSDTGLSYLKAVDYGDYFGVSENQNFYDNSLAYGAMYYATGLSKWLTYFNTLSDNWWSLPLINKGQCREGPMAGSQCHYQAYGSTSLTGLMLWAEANGTQTTVYDGLEELNNYQSTSYMANPYPSTDIRPSGYALAWQVLQSQLDPDGTRATAATNWVTNGMADMFSADQQHPDGAFEHGSNNGTIPASTVGVTNGSTTVTCTTTCNFTTATHAGKYFIAYSSIQEIFSQSGNRRDEILISSVDEGAQTLTLASAYPGATQTGLSWRYAPLSLRIMQPFIQAMPMMGMVWQRESGYADTRQRAVDALNYNRTRGYRSYTGGFYSVMDDAGCWADIQAQNTNSNFDCQFTNDAGVSDFSGSRYLLQEPMRASAYAAKYASELNDANKTALATFTDTMLGHAFGKFGGPESDYDSSTCSTCYAAELNDGNTTFSSVKNKNWGFGFGFGGAYVWDALRTNAPEAETLVSYSVPLDIAGVTNAVDADVTLYEPKGSVSRSVNDNTGSTASVTGDARQGSHLARIIYRDSMGAALQTDWEMVAAPLGAGVGAQIDGAVTITGSVSF